MRHGIRLMGRTMGSTGEMIGIPYPDLIATRSCKSTDFLRLHFFSRLVALRFIGFKYSFESYLARIMMGFTLLLILILRLQR